MHRLSKLARPSRRAFASLSQVSASRLIESRPMPQADLFEDDIINAMFAPTIPVPPPTPDEAPSVMLDSLLYGPAAQAAYDRQLRLEEETVDNAVLRFRNMSEQASSRGDVVSHRTAHDLLLAWYNPFILALHDATEGPARPAKRRRSGRKSLVDEVSGLLTRLSPDAIAVITIHSLLSALMRDCLGIPLTRAAFLVADAVRAEMNMKLLVDLRRNPPTMPDVTAEVRDPASLLARAKQSSTSLVSAVNHAAAELEASDLNRSTREQLLLGTQLIDLFMSVAKVPDSSSNGQDAFVPALQHVKIARKNGTETVGVLQLTEAAMELMKQESPSLAEYVSPKQQPMVVRPRPWVSPADGAYLRCKTSLVRRAPGSNRDVDRLLATADLDTLYTGLNALGDQPWCVNRHVLGPAETLWESGDGIAGLVTKTNCEVPERKAFLAAELKAFEQRKAEREIFAPREADEEEEEEDAEETFDEVKALRKLRAQRRKAQKANRELVSMRADTDHRMRQARRFAGEERIWLPHNVDFRGRAYPVPVHLQHMGCDLTRALLTFASPGVPLGERGVYWLKVHLANLLGGDKLSFSERVQLAEDNMEKAIRVGREPLSESNLEWWSSAEDPFQLLAACAEISNACGRYGGEKTMESYASCLPVSMDGSCNGLQHYAALGRDIEGGTQVNLVPNSRPQDVYTGVAKLVSEKVDKLAEEGDEHAQVLQGKISRKVVKQTVMTSVYGVTAIGARQQVMNRLAEVDGIPESKLFRGSTKVAQLTLSSLGDIFHGATQTMEWLYSSAHQISRTGHKVQWTTPVGLPAIQPYRRSERRIVKTILQRVAVNRSEEHTPVSTSRQRSAFPPNYVHSIDSAHMLKTAMKCNERGMNFAAVHDSFWTNAAHVDAMNSILREEFIRLHERDLLDELREGFLMRYGDKISFPELPARGELDLQVVRDSPYFFS